MSHWIIKTPETYMTYAHGRYNVMHKRKYLGAGKHTMGEAISMAMAHKVTMASISWNEDIKNWVAASTLGNRNEVHVASATSRYSVEVEEEGI